MYYVGLNIHQRSTSVEILGCNGKLVKPLPAGTHPSSDRNLPSETGDAAVTGNRIMFVCWLHAMR